MSDTKKLMSPFANISQLEKSAHIIWVEALGCDASSASFCTQYYYLKVAFRQSFTAPDIGLVRKEFLLFISSGPSGIAHEEISGEFAK
jgi:hypothetical protein